MQGLTKAQKMVYNSLDRDNWKTARDIWREINDTHDIGITTVYSALGILVSQQHITVKATGKSARNEASVVYRRR